MALHVLAEIAVARGDREAALAHFREAVALRRLLGDRHGEAIALRDLARVQAEGGDTSAAITTLTEAGELLQPIDPQEATKRLERAAKLRG